MAKRRAPSKEDMTEQARQFEDTFERLDDLAFRHPLDFEEEEVNEDDWSDPGDSAYDWWWESKQMLFTFMWWVDVNFEALIECGDRGVVCEIYQQVSDLIELERYGICADDLQKLLAIKHLLGVAMMNAQEAMGWVSDLLNEDHDRDHFAGVVEPPVRRKILGKSLIPPDAEEDPRDDRTSWKRGLIRTRRFGIMSVKDAREVNMAMGSDEWKQLIHVDAAPRVRVKKPWMIRGSRRRRQIEMS